MANKRVSVSERMKKPIADSLFSAIDNIDDKAEETNKQENNETSKQVNNKIIEQADESANSAIDNIDDKAEETNKQENNETSKQVNNKIIIEQANENANSAAEETSKQESNEIIEQANENANTKNKDEKYTRQTYYLTKDLIDALAVYSTFEKLDKSEIVRNALDKYIPEKYKEMAKEIKEM